MATKFVESLKRLYAQGKITKEYVAGLVNSGKITEEDYIYIVGYTLEGEKVEEE